MRDHITPEELKVLCMGAKRLIEVKSADGLTMLQIDFHAMADAINAHFRKEKA